MPRYSVVIRETVDRWIQFDAETFDLAAAMATNRAARARIPDPEPIRGQTAVKRDVEPILDTLRVVKP